MEKIGKFALAVIKFFADAMRDDDGAPSSSRILMFSFSISTIVLLFMIFTHLFRMKGDPIVGVWLANLPIIIASLVSLIAAPYLINQGANFGSNVADSISRSKAISNPVVTAVSNLEKGLSTVAHEDKKQ